MHGFENDLLKTDRDLRIEFTRQNRLIGHLHHGYSHRTVGDKRQAAGHHFVKHNAGGIDIGSGIDRCAAGLLGTDVIDRADGLIGHGNCLGFGVLGDAEIGHLDGAVGQKHNILRLDIAVNDLFLMCVREGAQNLFDIIDGFLPGERADTIDVILQGDAVDKLHDDIFEVIGNNDIQNFYDVFMVEHGNGFGFVDKPLDGAFVVLELVA